MTNHNYRILVNHKYKILLNQADFKTRYSAEEVSGLSLPERNGQFIFIDNCYLPLVKVLQILKKDFSFEKFLLIRCLINRKICIRVMFFSDQGISRECKTYYDGKSSKENVISVLQGPIKPKFHNLAKYRFLKAFCDSYLGMTSENLLCSNCCREDVQITINTYFCWRFDYKRVVLKPVKEKEALLAQLSPREQIRYYLNNPQDLVEWGAHRFDIEDVSVQMDVVDAFFKEMRSSNDPFFSRQQSKEVYKTLPDGRKLFLGFRK